MNAATVSWYGRRRTVFLEDAQAAPSSANVADAKELAKQDPKLVASVVKEWMGGNEPR